MPPDTSKTAPTPSVADWAARDSATSDLLGALTPIFDAAFANLSHVVLAVSGGSDSMALLHLAAAWAAARADTSNHLTSPTLSVVTVDHALRAGSAAEATRVADVAERLRLQHTTLLWQDAKPATGIQAAARNARLSLIRAHLSANDWPAIAMAHTADDQAETVLMRLARGSGVDGLAAMQTATPIGAGQTLLRPLLDVTKAELERFLTVRGVCWIEDPSNQSTRFERVRVRRARAALAAEGIDLESLALARTATRMARACAALTQTTRAAWSNRDQHADFTALGFATLDWDWLLTHPDDIRLRLLTGLLETIGGQGALLSLGQLERLTIGANWQLLTGTLHGVQLRQTQRKLQLFREVGRSPPPPVKLTPGDTVVWDGRFSVSAPATLAIAVVLASLGRDGVSALRAADVSLPRVPAAVLWTLPALRHPDGALVAVPAINYVAQKFAASMPQPVTSTPIGPVFAKRAWDFGG